MASGIRIPFVADVRDWVRGTRTIRDDLGDVERDLEGLAREADDTAGDIERDFEAAGRDIEDVFADIEREAERSFDDIERKADQTDIGDQLSRSARQSKMAEVGAELGDELSENLGEGFRSGNFADTIFESLTSLAPVLGPLGVVIGGAAGLAGGILRGMADTAEDIQAAATSLFDNIAGDAELSGKQASQAFRRGWLEDQDIDDQLEAIFGSMQEGWRKVEERTIQTGLEADVVAAAYLGNADALALVDAALAGNQLRYRDILTEQGKVFDTDRARWEQLEDVKDTLGDEAAALQAIINKGQPLQKQNEDNLRLYRLRRDAIDDISGAKPPNFESLANQLGTVKSDAERAKWALDNMPTNKTVRITVNPVNVPPGPLRRAILDSP